MIHMSAAEFKAKCLKLMDRAQQKHESVIITKYGQPVAKLVPYDEENVRLFGFMKGSVIIKGNIIEPSDETWDADIS